MACPARGKVGQNNIVVHSRKDERYQCKICRKTFAATTGTPFYRLHQPLELMVIVATLVAHGCPLQAIVAAFHLDERTVMAWQERAGRHAQRVHEHLVQHPRNLEHVQADEIRVKAQGKVVWLAMAMMVSTCLWLGGVVTRKRDEHLILALVQIIRSCALARPLLNCVDGFIAYVQVVGCGRRPHHSSLPTAHPLHILPNRCSPSSLIIPHLHKPVKARPGPFHYTLHQPVFHRIVMDVIPMPVEVSLIPVLG